MSLLIFSHVGVHSAPALAVLYYKLNIIVNPPSPSEILKAVRGMVWIFSGIAQ